MLRKVLSLLLIGPLILQGIAVPHAHAPCDLAESDAHQQRPHIHLSRQAPHVHRAPAAHRSQPTRGAYCDENRLAHHDACPLHLGVPVECCVPPHDHDDDAIYLAGWAIALGPVKNAPTPTPFDAVPLLQAQAGLASAVAQPYTWAPPRYGEHVPVFLQTGKLLI